MQLTDFARKVPDEVWALFAPILPPVVWCGNGAPTGHNLTKRDKSAWESMPHGRRYAMVDRS
jgi:hypothetical protein